MEGERHSVISADGTTIGLLTAGSGPGLLLVHGGMGRLERWFPLWQRLSSRWRVTAMDRRGRASSGDSPSYLLEKEFDDVAAVATWMAEDQGEPVDVFGHSYGATCALGAADSQKPFRKVVLFEPPGSATVPMEWVQRVDAWLAAGQVGRAMASFLHEIIGLTAEQVEALRQTGGARDVLATAAATMSREAHALTTVDLTLLAERVRCPVLLLTGSDSPQWARDIANQLTRVLAHSESVTLAGQGHEAIDTAPGLILAELRRFLLADHGVGAD